MITSAEVQSTFTAKFGGTPLLVRAPGRINLIGEHTDYNDGFVMPAAVDKEVYFAIGPSADGRSVVYSLNYDEIFEIDLENLQPADSPSWANYLLGVLYKFREQGLDVKPFRCAFGGNIPSGAGLSSSAAVECGFGCALSALNRLGVPPLQLVQMAQWAEHHYVGVKCGIMDQFASVMGRQGHVIVLDCRALTHRYAPLDLRENEIVLCDTKVKHALVDSEYNARRKECESGVEILQRHNLSVRSLRDVTAAMLEQHRQTLPEKVYQRCRYVVEEIERVEQASRDLDEGNLAAFGKKMFETHEGLSTLFEVSCKELDFLVEQARAFDGVSGARMMGGGFGGCTINLVRKSRIEEFIAEMASRYKDVFGIDMPAYRVKIVDGVSRMVDPEPVG